MSRQRIRLPVWYVIRFKPGCGWQAMKRLKAQGFQTLWVRMIDERGKLTPLFKDYMFVESLDRQWHVIKSTPGVMSVVTVGDSPARMPRDVMQQILASLNEEGFVEYDQVHGRLKVGEAVTITKGSFQNVTGLYIGRTPDERVNVLFELLGRRVTVSVPRSHVSRPTGAAAASLKSTITSLVNDDGGSI